MERQIMPSTAGVPPMPASGLDAFHHQGSVNWHFAAEGGISFAFAKATDGGTFVDPQFEANWLGMKDAGIFRSAYHFFGPAKPLDSQVDNFVQTVGEIDDGDLDLEKAPTPDGDSWEEIPVGNRVPLVVSWLQAVEARRGRKPIVYTHP